VLFLRPDVSPAEVEQQRTFLQSDVGIERFVFVDQDEAYAEFVSLFADSPELIEQVVRTDLPPSFRVTWRGDVAVGPDQEDQWREWPSVTSVVAGADPRQWTASTSVDGLAWKQSGGIIDSPHGHAAVVNDVAFDGLTVVAAGRKRAGDRWRPAVWTTKNNGQTWHSAAVVDTLGDDVDGEIRTVSFGDGGFWATGGSYERGRTLDR